MTADILRHVRALIEPFGVHVLGYGPVVDKPGRRKECKVLLPGPKDRTLPDRTDVGGTRVDLRYDRQRMGPKLRSTAPLRRVRQGPDSYCLGGESITNIDFYDPEAPTQVFWGTNTFYAQQVTFFGAGGVQHGPFQDVCVGCAHVLQSTIGSVGDVVTAPGYPYGLRLLWVHPEIEQQPVTNWADVAVAEFTGSPPQKPGTSLNVFGLGNVRQIGTQPDIGSFCVKFGATTGLTGGFELGLVLRRLPDGFGDLYMLRTVSGRFCAPGDSGAAVLDASNNLLGIVIGGASEVDENWYVPVFDGAGGPDPLPDQSFIRLIAS
jgi:hypothetical protein